MALSKIAKKFDKCMSEDANTESCSDCPLYKDVTLEIGASHDKHGRITWEIQGCSLMAILDPSLRQQETKSG